MAISASYYFQLATREGFNAADSHIENTIAILHAGEKSKNLADVINELIVEKQFTTAELTPTLYMLLVEKWGYAVLSRNLKAIPSSAQTVIQEISQWNGVDIVLVYHHPDLGEIAVNPKNPLYADFISDFKKNELVVVFAGFCGKHNDAKDPDNNTYKALAHLACQKCVEVLEGAKNVSASKAASALKKGTFVFKAAKEISAKTSSSKKANVSTTATKKANTVSAAVKKAQELAAAKTTATTSGATTLGNVTSPQMQSINSQTQTLRKMSPMISIPVTNELFHNGNVEAWKRIIASYNHKYPDLQIYVYYDGERIMDINTLFKWGKVKHGSSIQFAVVGENIQDVAKLKRYFMQGASSQFEAFLRNAPGTILKLF